MSRLSFISIIFLLQSLTQGIGQTVFTGTIICADDKLPLIGAHIQEVNTENIVIADVNGDFTIEMNSDSVLVQYVGYQSRYMNIKKTSRVDPIELDQYIIDCWPVIYDKRYHTPHNASTLDQRELSLKFQANPQQYLNTMPGLFMQSGALNTNRISVRGIGNRSPFSTSKLKAYLNDIPLTNGVGETTIEDLELSQLKSIKLWRGPTQSQYGASLGGMMQLETRKPIFQEFMYQTKNSYGSFNTFKTANEVSVFEGNTHFYVGQNYLSSDGYRDNNRIRRMGIWSISDITLRNAKITVLFNHVDLEAQIPSALNIVDYNENPTMAAPNWASVEGGEDSNKNQIGISFSYPIAYKVNWISSIYHFNYLNYESRPFNILDEDSNVNGIRSKMVFSSSGEGDFELTTGVELYKEDYDYNTFITEGGMKGDLINSIEEDRYYQNYFAEVYWPINKFIINGGLSLNNINYQRQGNNFNSESSFGLVLSPSLSISHMIDNRFINYASISHGISQPTLEESLLPDGSINNDINLEQGWNFELGHRAKLFYEKLTYDLNLYHMKVSDMLVARRTGLDEYWRQ